MTAPIPDDTCPAPHNLVDRMDARDTSFARAAGILAFVRFTIRQCTDWHANQQDPDGVHTLELYQTDLEGLVHILETAEKSLEMAKKVTREIDQVVTGVMLKSG